MTKGIVMLTQEIKNSLLEMFEEQKVMMIREMATFLECSNRTVQRLVKQWRMYKSYNHNARFFTIEAIAQFDQHGLWRYRDIGFSRYGNLRQTVVSLIQRSPAGLTGKELGQLLGLSPRSFLSHFSRDTLLHREMIDNIFIYFHGDQHIKKQQLRERMAYQKRIFEERQLPDTQRIIAVLVELVKYPQIHSKQILCNLANKGCPMTEEELEIIFRHYQLPKKKLDLLMLRSELIQRCKGNLPAYCLLPDNYLLDVETDKTVCVCGGKLRRRWLKISHPVGILLGRPCFRHHIKQCACCGNVFRYENLRSVKPPNRMFAYDIIVEVGLSRFTKMMQNSEIQTYFADRYHLSLSSSTINSLTDQFLHYFSAVHYTQASLIKRKMAAEGGYPLSLDGTCEAGTDIVFALVNAKNKWVLDSSRMPTENMDDIIILLKRCITLFGEPLATMRDLNDKIAGAIQKVLPGVRDLVCHYHFLLNVGEKLLAKQRSMLIHYFRSLKIFPSLRNIRKEQVKCSKRDNPLSEDILFMDMRNQAQLNVKIEQIQRYFSYLILRWVIDYGNDLKGEYFPFDLSNLAFYKRCTQLYDMLMKIMKSSKLQHKEWRTLHTITKKLAPFRKDKELVLMAERMEKSAALFNQLRMALSFKHPEGKPLLRQNKPLSTVEVALDMERRLIEFRKDLDEMIKSKADADVKHDVDIILSYLDKYWYNLFGHVVSLPENDSFILLERTNNIIEYKFSDLKRELRRRIGTKKLARYIQTMKPEQLLVTNLAYKDYVDLLYGGSLTNMASVFAKHWKEGDDRRKKAAEKSVNSVFSIRKKTLRSKDFLKLTTKFIKTIIRRKRAA